MRLPVLTLMLLAASSSVVVACGAGVPEQRSPGPGRASVGELPTSSRYVLRASCGERQLAGRYRVVVRHGTVVAVRPGADPRRTGLGLGEFPTLADLVDKAEHSEPEAVV